MTSNLRAAGAAVSRLRVQGTAVGLALVLAAAALPVRAQVVDHFDISGTWVAVGTQEAQERGYGLLPGDWAGIPLSTAGRAFEYSYSAELRNVPSSECRPHLSPWEVANGAAGLRFAPVIGSPLGPDAGRIVAWQDRDPFVQMTIWMNGMPQPSEYAAHPAFGFTVGHWKGNMLIAHTTHLKVASIRREIAYASDEATITSTFIPHGDLMTAVFILHDPAYLTQPYIYTVLLVRGTSQPPVAVGGRAACLPNEEGTSANAVPFYLPGKSDVVGEMMKYYHIPEYASEGGADTMYPAFRDRLKAQYLKLYPTFPSAKNCKDFCSSPADLLAFGADH